MVRYNLVSLLDVEGIEHGYSCVVRIGHIAGTDPLSVVEFCLHVHSSKSDSWGWSFVPTNDFNHKFQGLGTRRKLEKSRTRSPVVNRQKLKLAAAYRWNGQSKSDSSVDSPIPLGGNLVLLALSTILQQDRRHQALIHALEIIPPHQSVISSAERAGRGRHPGISEKLWRETDHESDIWGVERIPYTAMAYYAKASVLNMSAHEKERRQEEDKTRRQTPTDLTEGLIEESGRYELQVDG
ncbi:hypothetical protein F5146DRAFT_998866 [Armillaria mellea]|nr:hypothetical protein F5146DRAFT_998866 [Armillaria mellea]